ncbi:hypothetical protein [Nocardia sp. CNY236]|uniref:hypothetical protein n=1 Tax=Nocardia sp. CNY236 TaxID=1169152 RepID=UPI00041AA4B3|nr:hypothetical protein [Nocardia sp. CNY236]
MSFGAGHPLSYPLLTTLGTLATCTAWALFATVDQVAALAAVALGVLGYTGYRFAVAVGLLRIRRSGHPRTVRVARVHQFHRLTSRSWLEIDGEGAGPQWVPVYFDPALTTLTKAEADLGDRVVHSAGRRLYPSGRIRGSEPPGRLIDNPSRPDPAAPAETAKALRLRRRLLLDAQPAVAAPLAALLWVFLDGGGLPAFLGATTVAAMAATWLSAIRGSDPT